MAPLKRKSNTASDKYGSSEKRDFHVYDKVFARLRGYPPWPAKITNIKVDAKSKSLKSKCEVYFYGSNQIGKLGIGFCFKKNLGVGVGANSPKIWAKLLYKSGPKPLIS